MLLAIFSSEREQTGYNFVHTFFLLKKLQLIKHKFEVIIIGCI